MAVGGQICGGCYNVRVSTNISERPCEMIVLVKKSLTADMKRKILALETRYFHRLLGILFRDRITNAEVKNRIMPLGNMMTSLQR